MPFAPMFIYMCECEHIFFVFQPEAEKLAANFGKGMAEQENFTIVLAKGQVINCPGCGNSYSMPVGEELDADRTAFGKFLEDMASGIEEEE